jgi:hypothetical protein
MRERHPASLPTATDGDGCRMRLHSACTCAIDDVDWRNVGGATAIPSDEEIPRTA